jgi:hypothetical protein
MALLFLRHVDLYDFSRQENILVETDCLDIASMVRSNNVGRSCFGHLVEDLGQLFSLERIVSITKILGSRIKLVMS